MVNFSMNIYELNVPSFFLFAALGLYTEKSKHGFGEKKSQNM